MGYDLITFTPLSTQTLVGHSQLTNQEVYIVSKHDAAIICALEGQKKKH